MPLLNFTLGVSDLALSQLLAAIGVGIGDCISDWVEGLLNIGVAEGVGIFDYENFKILILGCGMDVGIINTKSIIQNIQNFGYKFAYVYLHMPLPRAPD